MVEENVTIKRNDLRLLIIAAFRYSLGRRTFMPSIVTELIINNYKLFNDQDWKNFIEDINYQKNLHDLGDNCDIETWNNFEVFCKKRIGVK
jgi:hypothetical protein